MVGRERGSGRHLGEGGNEEWERVVGKEGMVSSKEGRRLTI